MIKNDKNLKKSNNHALICMRSPRGRNKTTTRRRGSLRGPVH